MLKKLIGHTAIYGIAPYVPQIANIAVLPFITPFLTATDYGVWGLILAYSSAITAFQNLGMTVVLNNSFFNKDNNFKYVWRRINGLIYVWSFIIALLLAFILWNALPIESTYNKYLVVLSQVIPVILFGGTGYIISLYYKLSEKPYPVAIRTAIFGLLTIILNLYFIKYLKFGYLGFVYSSFISLMLTQLSWLPDMFKEKLVPSLEANYSEYKKWLKLAIPTIPHTYSNYLLSTSDRIVMDVLNINISDIGKYNVAYSLGNVINGFVGASYFAISPSLFKAYNDRNIMDVQSIIFILASIVLTGCLVVSFWTKEILSFLFRGESFKGIYYLASILIISYTYRPFYYANVVKIYYIESTKLLLNITFLASILNVSLNIALIPIYGYEFAIYTTFATHIFMGFIGFYIPSVARLHDVKYYNIFWLFLIGICLILSLYIIEQSVLIKIIASLLCGGIGIYFTWMLNKRFNNQE